MAKFSSCFRSSSDVVGQDAVSKPEESAIFRTEFPEDTCTLEFVFEFWLNLQRLSKRKRFLWRQEYWKFGNNTPQQQPAYRTSKEKLHPSSKGVSWYPHKLWQKARKACLYVVPFFWLILQWRASFRWNWHRRPNLGRTQHPFHALEPTQESSELQESQQLPRREGVWRQSRI